jgi:putative ABC transport system permease protein
VAESVPATGANLYVIGAGQGQIEEASAWLRNQSAIERELQAFPLVWLRLSMRNETKLGAAAGEWLATCSNSAPAGSVILSRQAAAIGAKPGDRLEFHGRGKTVSARVAAGQINYLDEAIATLTFHCSAFEGIRTFYHAAIRVRPGEEDSVRRTLAARYPLLPTLSRAELAGFVQRLADHATAMARMISWQVLAIGCGLQLLLVAAAKRMRLGEAAVMKALGASPARVAATFCFEHGALGMTAGLAGGIAGAALASLLLSLLFHRVTIAVDVATILGSGAGTGLLAAVSGGLGSWSLLRSRPFELLRED